jgi:hypothetical protein
MLGYSLFLMTTDNSRQPALSADDVLVYVGNQAANFDAGDNYEEEAGIRRRAREQGLEVVTVDDSELDRLRNQVQRIVSRLEAPDGKPQDGKRQDGKPHDQGFSVDSVTVHVGLSASGHFFLVASAEIEAAIDITWTRKR